MYFESFFLIFKLGIDSSSWQLKFKSNMLQLFDLEFWLSIGSLSLQFKIRYIFECCSFVDFQAKYWFYLIAFKTDIFWHIVGFALSS